MFFVIELATRRVEIAGITPSPNEAWMMQIGRNITDPVDGFLAEKELLILDRDSKFSMAFRDLLKDADVDVVRLPYRSPNLNEPRNAMFLMTVSFADAPFSAVQVLARTSPDGGNPPPGRAAGIAGEAAVGDYATLISTFLGFAVSIFGTVTSRTPSL